MRRRWPLTLRGAGAVVIAIGCFVLARELGSAELVYFGCLMLALVAVCVVVLHVGRRAGRVTRSLTPDVVGVGSDARVRLDVVVRSALPMSSGRWVDRLADGVEGEAAGILPTVGSSFGRSDGRMRLEYTLRGVRRGEHRIGPLAIELSDPFGIARSTQSAGGSANVLVVPATVDLDPIGEFTGDLGGALNTTTDQFGQGADNLTARPYTSGDSMRRIHWRATAHHDALMVRQEERESTPEATVVLDRSGGRWSAAARQAPGADPLFEAALTAFVSVVAQLSREGYLVEVLDGDGRALVAPVSGGDSGEEIAGLLRACATLTAVREDQLPQLVPLFAGASAGPIVLITGALDDEDVTTLRPLAHHSALPVLLCGHGHGHGDDGGDDDAADADRLADTGWRTGILSTEAELSALWHTVAPQGVLRGQR